MKAESKSTRMPAGVVFLLEIGEEEQASIACADDHIVCHTCYSCVSCDDGCD